MGLMGARFVKREKIWREKRKGTEKSNRTQIGFLEGEGFRILSGENKEKGPSKGRIISKGVYRRFIVASAV